MRTCPLECHCLPEARARYLVAYRGGIPEARQIREQKIKKIWLKNIWIDMTRLGKAVAQ